MFKKNWLETLVEYVVAALLLFVLIWSLQFGLDKHLDNLEQQEATRATDPR